jgi:NADH:ubiquinone oxidoreductase subunit K
LFPFTTPLTVQTTDVSVELLTRAVKLARCSTASVPLPGVTLTVTALAMVTVAAAEIPPATASIVTTFGEGRSAGAV